jgi:hypothetical protein
MMIAIRRTGELLEAIEPNKGGRPFSFFHPEGETGDRENTSSETSGGAPTSSRTEAAQAAGMSKQQQVQAVRAADVPAISTMENT